MAVILCAAMSASARSQDTQSAPQRSLPLSSDPSGPKKVPIDKFDYYDDGKVMACSKLTPEGKLDSKLYYYHDGKVRKEERYDQSGEKIEESNYDNDGKLDDNIDGWAAKRWIYKDGNLRGESTYGEDGHLIERKIYNEQGDLVDRQYVGDGTIDPSEEFNRGSVVTHETDQFYDKYGNQTGSVTTEVDDPDDMFGDMY
jgi:hypothetical protein